MQEDTFQSPTDSWRGNLVIQDLGAHERRKPMRTKKAPSIPVWQKGPGRGARVLFPHTNKKANRCQV